MLPSLSPGLPVRRGAVGAAEGETRGNRSTYSGSRKVSGSDTEEAQA